VSEHARAFVEPLITHRWSGYLVRFPDLKRELPHEYATVTGVQLERVVKRQFASAPHCKLALGDPVSQVQARRVTLRSGRVFDAELVIDGRGPERWQPGPDCRFQKFVGLELALARPAPIDRPLLMDACVSQHDGLRFMYVLPFAPRRVLIEDTYFSDSADLDDGELQRRVLQYAAENGYQVDHVLRRERGVLPLPLKPPQPRFGAPLLSGFHGGWFHPTTGYSFPAAVKLAEYVAARPAGGIGGADFERLLHDLARQQRFFCFLNTLLYRGFAPDQRFSVLQRFYRLPADSVRRFYALQTTTGDRARLLCGRPPRGLSLSHAFSTVSAS
jgi:lycopene beta-cyclase